MKTLSLGRLCAGQQLKQASAEDWSEALQLEPALSLSTAEQAASFLEEWCLLGCYAVWLL
jgi:hypothetical protein